VYNWRITTTERERQEKELLGKPEKEQGLEWNSIGGWYL